MAPMLAVAEPLMHGVGRMPLKDLNGAFDGLYPPGDQWYWRGDFFDSIPDEAVRQNRGMERQDADLQERYPPVPRRRGRT